MTQDREPNPHKKKEPTCPYWQKSKCGSKIGTDGLYIPLDEHIQMYCESPNYSLCSQYLECDDAEQNKTGPKLNKRKRARVSSKQPITIVYLNDSGNVVSKEIHKAMTIDLSMGGMRLITDEPIMKNSLIQFSLNDADSSKSEEGIAISRWCNQLQDQDRYHVGFAYHNKETSARMSHYFNSAIKRGDIHA